MSNYTFDPTLSRLQLDTARSLLGDTDIELVGSDHPYALFPDETILGAFTSFGWVQGMAFLLRSLLTRFGQEPERYAEANGVSYSMSERLQQWRGLLNDVLAGKIPDPTSSDASNGVPYPSGVACVNPTW